MIQITKEEVEKLFNGDQRTQNKFFKENKTQIKNWVNKYVKHKEDQEDLILIILTKILRSIKIKDDSYKTFGAWCYRISYNTIVNYLIQQQKAKNSPTNKTSIDEIYNLSVDEMLLDDYISFNMKIDTLSDFEKKILDLKMSSYSDKKICEEMNLKINKLLIINESIKNKIKKLYIEEEKENIFLSFESEYIRINKFS